MRRVPRRVAPRVNIRRELEILSETHPTIPFEQFLQRCRDNDLPELEARSMAKDLTASGVAAHFPDHGEPWADTLFLRPAEILRAFDAAVGDYQVHVFEHVPGVANKVPDWLSRVRRPPEQGKLGPRPLVLDEAESLSAPTRNAAWWRTRIPPGVDPPGWVDA